MDECPTEAKNEPASLPSSQTQPLPSSQAEHEDREVKARVDAVWQQLDKGVSTKTLYSIVNSNSSTGNKAVQKEKVSHNWMTVLGLGLKKTEANGTPVETNRTTCTQNQNGTSEEAKKLAAVALAAAKDAAAASAALARGKIEVTEIRDFAGEEIEVKKLVDPNSKEAAEQAKVSGGASSAVDAVLEQIKKKPKLSVLDKTKKDWGEFKGEHKGLEDELDAYKKSSNQYLDRVSFLQRADYREFERERDARLAMQSKRRPDMREGP